MSSYASLDKRSYHSSSSLRRSRAMVATTLAGVSSLNRASLSMSDSSHHFANAIVGVPRLAASRATNPNVSRQRDGMSTKSTCPMISRTLSLF